MACGLIPFVLFLSFKAICGCSEEEFPCNNGQCINKLNWCDGIEDCKDMSDEKYCRHGPNSDPNLCSDDPNFFLCKDGRCIPSSGKCDGLRSCIDNSDEMNCNATEVTAISYDHVEINLNGKETAPSHSINYSVYSDVRYNSHKQNLEDARSWLIAQWDEDSGWGENTARAIIALYLSNANHDKSYQKLLITKQLDLQLFVALTRNSSKKLSLCHLSHYINALSATCRNPRNFNGNNLVRALRDRVDSLDHRLDFVSPYVYLTLCIHNFTKYEDVLNMQKSVRSNFTVVDKFDMLSLSVLFASCVSKSPAVYDSNFRTDMLSRLIEKIDRLGIPKNVYELSLVVQAMTEVRVDPSRWYREEAMNFILDNQKEDGSFGDFLATYYTIPILTGKSMLDVTSLCNKSFSQVHQADSRHSKIRIFYSLYFGYPVELTQKITVYVTEGTNFLHTMHLAQEKNPYFRFQLDKTKDIPFVYSIGGVPNDAENGLYWKLYINSRGSRPELNRFENDIRYCIPQDDEEMIFWHRPLESHSNRQKYF